MSLNILRSLSLPKYERMLPRVFPGVAQLEIRDRQNQLFWQWSPAANRNDDIESIDENPVVAWTTLGFGIDKRQLPSGRMQFRAPIALKDHGPIAWLLTAYETQPSVALSSAPEPLRRAFADAQMLLQEDIELQLECNQLAAELGERYKSSTSSIRPRTRSSTSKRARKRCYDWCTTAQIISRSGSRH